MITNSKLVKLVFVEVSSLFDGWRHCLPKLIEINYSTMFGMKWLWLVPNLVKIYPVFLKL